MLLVVSNKANCVLKKQKAQAAAAAAEVGRRDCRARSFGSFCNAYNSELYVE